MIISLKNKKILSYTMDLQSFKAVPPPISPKLQETNAITNNIIHQSDIPNKKRQKETICKQDKKQKRKRCHFDGCRMKLKLTDLECRCINRYCSKHRLPESHECTHNYQKMDFEEFCKKVGLGGGEVRQVEKI